MKLLTSLLCTHRGFVVSVSMLLLGAVVSCDRAPSPGGESASEATVVPSTQDWPLFRRDAEGRGVSDENLLPPLRLLWSHESPVAGSKKRAPLLGTPVISGGRVFYGGQDSRFRCLDVKTGQEIWVFEPLGGVVGAAAVADDLVIFGDQAGVLYGLQTSDGKERWRLEAGDKIEGGVNLLRLPAGEGRPEPEIRAFVGSHDTNLYCVNALTGKEIWKVETGNAIISTPSLVAKGGDSAVIFGGCDNLLHQLSALTGEKLGEEQDVGAYIANSSAARDGIVYVGHYGGEVLAIDVESGERVWTFEAKGEFQSSPAVTADKVYIGSRNKKFLAIDRVTGKEAWSFSTRRDVDASPVVCEGAVWIAGKDARLYALDPAKGTELFSYDLGAQVSASPAISHGVLVICAEDGIVYAFEHDAAAASGPPSVQP